MMKNRKHVTIVDSSLGPSSAEPQTLPQDDTTVHRGMHIPKHMLSPGEDGYRTPAIEDYAVQTAGPTTPNGARTPSGVATPNGHSTPNGVHHRLPHIRHHVNLSNSSLAHSIFDKLHWRERIRHYTWTFFTMTMATGGIANVLYTGIFGLRALDAGQRADSVNP